MGKTRRYTLYALGVLFFTIGLFPLIPSKQPSPTWGERSGLRAAIEGRLMWLGVYDAGNCGDRSCW
jgi:hypothetical protein